MKSAKFYVSLLLASCFAFASAGCSAKEVRFGPKALADYAEKCDAQQYKDADEWVDDANSNPLTYYKLDEEGVYCYAKGDEVEDFMDDLNAAKYYYDDSIDEVAVYLFADGRATLIVVSMKYSSEDDAEDMYDYYVDLFTKALVHGPDLITDDFDDKDGECTLAVDVKESYDDVYGLYLEGDTVMIASIASTSSDNLDYINDYMDDFCDEFEIKAPSELL